jgi:hypothetical protein
MDTPVTIILSVEQIEYIKGALLFHQCSDGYEPKHSSTGAEIGSQLMEDLYDILQEVKEAVDNRFPIYYLIDKKQDVSPN